MAAKTAVKSCHISDGLTEQGHPEADVKQGAIQVKREYVCFFNFAKICIKKKAFSSEVFIRPLWLQSWHRLPPVTLENAVFNMNRGWQ